MQEHLENCLCFYMYVQEKFIPVDSSSIPPTYCFAWSRSTNKGIKQCNQTVELLDEVVQMLLHIFSQIIKQNTTVANCLAKVTQVCESQNYKKRHLTLTHSSAFVSLWSHTTSYSSFVNLMSWVICHVPLSIKSLALFFLNLHIDKLCRHEKQKYNKQYTDFNFGITYIS